MFLSPIIVEAHILGDMTSAIIHQTFLLLFRLKYYIIGDEVSPKL